MMLGSAVCEISKAGVKEGRSKRLMVGAYSIDGPCCSVIDSGQALSLCHFSSFIPYHWILRGRRGEKKTSGFPPMMNGPMSAIQCGDKLTQSLQLICHQAAVHLIKTDAPLLYPLILYNETNEHFNAKQCIAPPSFF